MSNDAAESKLGELEGRIKELNDKGTQLLLFFSFAIVAAATLSPREHDVPLARSAIGWWVFAVFLVLLAILPVKEFCWKNLSWYRWVRGAKVALLIAAVFFSAIGAVQFLRAVSTQGILMNLFSGWTC